MKIRYSAPAISAFILALAFSASPRLIPFYFKLVSGEKIAILGDLKDFQTSAVTAGPRIEFFEIPVKNTELTSYGLGNFLYKYSVECALGASDKVVISRSIYSDLQSNLNNYVTALSETNGCAKLSIRAEGPPLAVRLHSGDSPIISGQGDVVNRVKWLNEFFVVSLPIFLAFVFFGLTVLYSFTNVFNFGTTAELARHALTAYSIYFILQAGFFAKIFPSVFTGNFTSKLNAFTALSALGVGLTSLSYTQNLGKRLGKYPAKKITFIVAMLSSFVFVTSNHREMLVYGYGVAAALLIFFGVKSKKIAVILLGLTVGLDSIKMGGVVTPFISRMSWFYISFVMIMDCSLRLYGMSKIFSAFSKAQAIADSHAEDLRTHLRQIAEALKDEMHFEFLQLRFLTRLNNEVSERLSHSSISIEVGEKPAVSDINEINFGVNKETLGTLVYGESPLTCSDLPSSTAITQAIQNEISARTPALFSSAFSKDVRKFDAIIDRLERELIANGNDRDISVEVLLTNLCERAKIRVVLGDYVPITHQVRVKFIRGFPQRVEERWLKGFLRATPDNLYGPLARGIHGKTAYIVPDVEVIKPFIHENTVAYYNEANTVSCFAIPIFERGAKDTVIGVLYAESSESNFDEGHRFALERLGTVVERLLQAYRDRKEIEKATTALSRFIPRTHVFALINGSQVTERDHGYLLMIDLKGSTQFSLKHGSDAWLARVEILQRRIREKVDSYSMTLQTFSWDAAFITLTSDSESIEAEEKILHLSKALAQSIQEWATDDKLLSEFWAIDHQKARFCLTFGDISRGLASGTTETWTVTGESMAVIAKMEAECKKLEGVFFSDFDLTAARKNLGFGSTGTIIRGVNREVIFCFTEWQQFLEQSQKSLDEVA
jgi:hypothetical protein